MTITLETFTAYRLARMANCGDPSNAEDSPGAAFLLGVQDDMRERWEWAAEHGEAFDSDTVSEIADGAVPVYTYDAWRAFTDLAAWEQDIAEYGPLEDMTKGAQVALYVIAERLCQVLDLEWTQRGASDDTDGE